MDKMIRKIQHKLGVEGTGPAGFKRGVRSDACKSLSGIVVKGDWTLGIKPVNRF